jgi:hypothetical protein
MNSTLFAVALQRPNGTFLEFHKIEGSDPALTVTALDPQIPLFPSRIGTRPPFGLTGSAIVQSYNESSLLISVASTLAPGSPVIVSAPETNRTPVFLTQVGLDAACATLAIPKSAIFTPLPDVIGGIMLFDPLGSKVANYAVINTLNFSMNSALTSVTQIEYSEIGYRRIVPGTLPAFLSPPSFTVLAEQSGSYKGYMYSGNSAPSTTGSIPTPTEDWMFAAAPNGNKTIAALCDLGRFCTLDISKPGVAATFTAVGAYCTYNCNHFLESKL